MNTVNVATLKKKLSHYLRLVESGEEILVTSHKRGVARIRPVNGSSVQLKEPTRPVSALLKLKGVKRKRPVTAVQSLIQDRNRR